MIKRKFIKAGAACMAAVLACYGCQKAPDKETQYQESVRETDRKQIPIEDMRKLVTKDFEELKTGKYSNLICDMSNPVVTESNTWYRLKSEVNECQLKGKALADVMRKNFQQIKAALGDDIKEHNSIVNFETGETIPYSEDFAKEVEKGNYDSKNYLYMLYESDAGEDEKDDIHRYMMTDWNNRRTMIRSGYMEANYEGLDIEEGKTVEIYYSEQSEKELQKKYLLCDGTEVAVSEAIKDTENYVNGMIQEKGALKKKADCVRVIQVDDKHYIYEISLVSVYDGIKFEREQTLETETQKEHEKTKRDPAYDIITVTYIGKNQIESYTNYAGGSDIKAEGDPISKVISLGNALEILSESIGGNSGYRIERIGIAYRNIYTDSSQAGTEAYPVWKIEGKNTEDEMLTRFYINVTDGQLEADRFLDYEE